MKPALSAAAMDTVQSGWAHSGWAAMIAALLWGIAACLWALTPARHRPALLLVLVAAGVPVLGWLTYCWGPGLGIAAFGLGVLTLTRRPLARLMARSARRSQAAAAAAAALPVLPATPALIVPPAAAE